MTTDRQDSIEHLAEVMAKHYPHPVFGCECMLNEPSNEEGQTPRLPTPWEFHVSAIMLETVTSTSGDKLENAVSLLQYALAIRMHGEDPDHRALSYTWRRFDSMVESFLRSLDD